MLKDPVFGHHPDSACPHCGSTASHRPCDEGAVFRRTYHNDLSDALYKTGCPLATHQARIDIGIGARQDYKQRELDNARKECNIGRYPTAQQEIQYDNRVEEIEQRYAAYEQQDRDLLTRQKQQL